MDPYLHPRYVPSPRLPPTPTVSRHPNLYCGHHSNHHHHHLPPPLPPPPPQPYVSLPPPPYHHNHQSQLAFQGPNQQLVEENSTRHPLSFIPSPRFSTDRNLFKGPEVGISCANIRSNSWDPSRVLHGNLRSDHDHNHHLYNHRSLTPTRLPKNEAFCSNKFRQGLGGVCVIGKEFDSGSSRNQNQECLLGRHDNCRQHDSYNRFLRDVKSVNMHVVSSNSNQLSRDMNFASDTGNQESHFGLMSKNEMSWDSRRDGVNENLMSHESVARRFDNMGRRDSNKQEFARSFPKKQLQKKSAFLRIQTGKPKARNRYDEQIPSKFNSFNGRDAVVSSSKQPEEKRLQTSVELDVSFKSNSLVAKTVLAPSSSSVVSDRSSSPKNRKVRKVALTETDPSNPKPTKLDKGLINSKTEQPSDNALNSKRGLKEFEKKDMVSDLAYLHLRSEVVVSDKENVDNAPNATPSTKARKKVKLANAKNKVDESSQSTILEKAGTNVDFCSFGTLNIEEIKNIEGQIDIKRSGHGEVVSISENKGTLTDIDDESSKPYFLNKFEMLHEHGVLEDSKKNLVEGINNDDSSNPKEMDISDNSLTKSEQEVTVSDFGSLDENKKQNSPKWRSGLLENGSLEFPKTMISVGRNNENGIIQEASMGGDISIPMSNNVSTNSQHNIVELVKFSNSVSVSVEGSDMEESSEIQGKTKDMFQLDLPSSRAIESYVGPVNTVSSIHDIDPSVIGYFTVSRNVTSPKCTQNLNDLASHLGSVSQSTTEMHEKKVSEDTFTCGKEVLNLKKVLTQSKEGFSDESSKLEDPVNDSESGRNREVITVHDIEGPAMLQNKNLSDTSEDYLEIMETRDAIPLEVHTQDTSHQRPVTDMEGDNYNPPVCTDFDVVSENSNTDLIELGPYSNMGSPVLNGELLIRQISKESASLGDVEKVNLNNYLQPTCMSESDQSITGIEESPQLQENSKASQRLKSTSEEPNKNRHQLKNVLPGRSSLSFNSSKKKVSLTHMAKPRTWHRTGTNPSSTSSSSPFSLPGKNSLPNTITPPGNSLKNIGIVQNTNYVRKGNSLVRTHAPVSSIYRLNPSGIDEAKKNLCSDFRVDVAEPSDRPRAGENSDSENPINQGGPDRTLENNLLNGGTSGSSKMNKITYIKRKSNQLVAATNIHESFTDDKQSLPSDSDGYYKRRDSKLIRSSFDCRTALDDNVSFSNVVPQKCGKISSKRLADKVLAGASKTPKLSLVWTLGGKDSTKTAGISAQRQKALPYLFPWKRASYWKNAMLNIALNPNNNSSSTIRKLMLSRMRDTVYTRSPRGFSLRKSKVLSVGGSNLKWSKSIERRSKKANEEATLAVAAVEKKKREQKGAKCRGRSSRKSVHSIERRPGERIFRIGVLRYKMDSSKTTLQRISDEESPCSTALLPQPQKDAKIPYIPRRLVIGNDEYVRIGNGNQLVRDPKKRVRMLASEKVRWSLHTARLRLARKQKYCQFFTRFGKCNKEDGKCLYIHDPSKVAVCTKFLNGLCSNPNCKLTHKVIPERMPDCSYFLQGFCTNENCPYRHVNVNPNASVCEAFLKGYCADGDECPKKHSYDCPVFKATGTCSQGSKCKLHHPKTEKRGKKRKRPTKQNSRGRYFGSTNADITKSKPLVVENSVQSNGGVCFQGKFDDYISLDFSDGEEGNINDLTRTVSSDVETTDLQLQDSDEYVKPLLLMKV